MEAIVLAGGKGTRLKSLVSDVPKPMASIAGRPFLEIVLDNLVKKGFSHTIISVGYMAEVVITHFGNNYDGMRLTYAIENEPLGTGGGVRLAMEQVNDGMVFVLNGDTYVDFEVEPLLDDWLVHKKSLIVAKEVEDTSRYGRLIYVDNEVVGFTEKGISGNGFINAGMYLISPSELRPYPIGSAFSFESDYLAPAVQSNRFRFHVCAGLFIDIGVPEDYVRAQSLF